MKVLVCGELTHHRRKLLEHLALLYGEPLEIHHPTQDDLTGNQPVMMFLDDCSVAEDFVPRFSHII